MIAGMRTSCALLLSALALALPATASAAYPVGQSPGGVWGSEGLDCGGTACTLVQDLLSNIPPRVPYLEGGRGVITSWEVRGAGGQARLRPIATSPDGGTPRGASSWHQLDGENQTFQTRLPVETDDAIGVDLSATASIMWVNDALGDDVIIGWTPALADGTTSQPNAGSDGYMALRAFVEPDVDADGLGDESQDPNVDQPGGGDVLPPGGGQPPPPGGDEPKPDPYAAIRKSGPKVKIAGKATAKRGVVSVSATNPYEFAIKGTIVLKSGRKKVGKATVKLGGGGARTVRVRAGRAARKRRLTAVATMKGPVGRKRTTKRTIAISKAAKPKPGKPGDGVDGTYRGDGLRADWAMGIEDGIVKSFSGQTTTSCAKSRKQKKVSFAMVGDDPKPKVAPDGSFAWEATKDYGFTKLKFNGKVNRNGTVTANMMVEDRSPITGADPITGMPRIEFDYCFVGEDFTLTRR
jgi:hypothetical protein